MKIPTVSLIAALGLGALIACTQTASAQDAKEGKKAGRGMAVEQRLERLSTLLNLTDAQKPKVKAVLEESNKKMQGLRDAAPEDRREKMRSIRDEENKKMKEILTPEQYEKYQKNQAAARERRPGGPGGEKKAPQEKAQ